MITTQKQVEQAEPKSTPHALGGNLYLNVEHFGSKQWLFVWKVKGRKQRAGLGSATGARGHMVTLVEARRKANDYRAIVDRGEDPRAETRRATTLFANYVETVIARLKPSWRHANTEKGWRLSLLNHAKQLANKPVGTLDSAAIKAVLDPIRHTKRESARHLRQRVEHIMREAKADGLRTGENPASRENLGWTRERGKRTIRHHPSMPYEMLPLFFASLDDAVRGHTALKLLILTATRKNEVVGARWPEFELTGDEPMWTIPAERVKNGSDHHVPLTKEMLALLASIQRCNEDDRLFPGYTSNTILPALKKIEGCRCFTAHGFRATFRTWCGGETYFARNTVEETYGHDASENAAERAYNRRRAMKKRRKVLEAWNAYATKIVPLRRAKRG